MPKKMVLNVSQASNLAILDIYSSNFRGVSRICSTRKDFQGFDFETLPLIQIHALTYHSSPLIRNPEMYSIYICSISISKKLQKAVFCWKRLRNKTRTRSTKWKSFFNFCLALASTISCSRGMQQEDAGEQLNLLAVKHDTWRSSSPLTCKNMENPSALEASYLRLGNFQAAICQRGFRPCPLSLQWFPDFQLSLC